ncbi:DUF1761 domain-containing protein [Mesobacterium sp. TK19101]|uniref:DUF1761 domain-containing protein n=1 Tax=Mesobacterium hydrothermale TaxID=3111907 RepID=A0ABU6HGJ8_9RHOB|nr:DUF1761 domain-containing protein [Mesobacterium sp. TK19101]MEC3861587.1 DUF1761 domain-containing protein [Mesobacterium sp. TK19101]
METVKVLVAAAASWVWGAVWYMTLSKPWLRAAGIECDPDGKPVGGSSPAPFILSALCMVLVAGMMRHMLTMSGITTVGGAMVTGAGIGLFFIAPWTMINNAYGMRPFTLTLIDGGYAVAGCTIMGLVLALF